VLALGWHPGQFVPQRGSHSADAYTGDIARGGRCGAVLFDDRSELLPRRVRTPPPEPLCDRPSAQLLGPDGRPSGRVQELASPARHQLEFLVAPQGPSTLRVFQFYFPGWDLRVDGRRLSEAALSRAVEADGLLRVALEPAPGGAVRRVRLSYDSPPGAGLGWALCLLAAVGLAGLELRGRFRRAS
jgi:hypothetical protein